ncbi:ricin-type beta-trefoil lectin domain protein [Kitasatospora misakiensis]|uniref:Ricin-type beta-trefoil lectin domain protein n=1 Tax=Kitasatospora misakiensis TaxID=67330 RepID=A0ABW0WZ05_9ACTN
MRRTATLFATALLAGASALTAGAAEAAAPASSVPVGAQAADPAGCTVSSGMWQATGTCTSMDPRQTWKVGALCQGVDANGIPTWSGAVSDGWVTGNGSSNAWCADSTDTIVRPGIALGPTPPAGPVGQITGQANKCLDVRGGSSTNGTPIQMWDCLGNVNQSWQIVSDGTIRAVGKCLDVKGGRTANGTAVQIYDCNGTGSQQWRVRPDGAIVNPQSGRVLDVRNYDTANGAPVQIWDFLNTANQLWHVPA